MNFINFIDLVKYVHDEPYMSLHRDEYEPNVYAAVRRIRLEVENKFLQEARKLSKDKKKIPQNFSIKIDYESESIQALKLLVCNGNKSWVDVDRAFFMTKQFDDMTFFLLKDYISFTISDPYLV